MLVVGCWLLVVGCWLLVVGCWLLVVGCCLLVVCGSLRADGGACLCAGAASSTPTFFGWGRMRSPPGVADCRGSFFRNIKNFWNRLGVDSIQSLNSFNPVLSKCVHILMVLAIFNPFCCCTAGVLDLDASDAHAVPAGAMHSCCHAQDSETSDAPATGDSSDSDHGEHPSDCPHKALKDYQASLEKGTTAAHPVLPTFLSALFAVIDFMMAEPVARSKHSVTLVTASQAPPPSVSQVYCVYRI